MRTSASAVAAPARSEPDSPADHPALRHLYCAAARGTRPAIGETGRRGPGASARFDLVMLSNSRGVVLVILIGVGAILARLVLLELSPVAASALPRGGAILTFSALTWGLILDAFANPSAPARGPRQIDTMLLYFSFTTLATTGYGGNSPVHPFAHSLSNLEAIIGQLYPRHGSSPARDARARIPAPLTLAPGADYRCLDRRRRGR